MDNFSAIYRLFDHDSNVKYFYNVSGANIIMLHIY